MEEPDEDGEVAAFVVGGEEDGVFVCGGHFYGRGSGCLGSLVTREALGASVG